MPHIKINNRSACQCHFPANFDRFMAAAQEGKRRGRDWVASCSQPSIMEAELSVEILRRHFPAGTRFTVCDFACDERDD